MLFQLTFERLVGDRAPVELVGVLKHGHGQIFDLHPGARQASSIIAREPVTGS